MAPAVSASRARLRALLAVATLAATACGSAGALTTAPPPVFNNELAHPSFATPVFTAAPSATPVPTPGANSAPPGVLPPVRATLSPDPVSVAGSHGGPMLGGCSVFPPDNAWNQDVSSLPVDPNSAAYIARIDSFRQFLHPDFGSDPSYGIPYVVVPGSQPFVPITFNAYGSESDPGPYPVPLNAPVEAGSDHHVLVADTGNCHLYEMFNAQQQGSGWSCDSG
ncbi:MAG: hypothetical protein JOZ46_02030, partial [Candidatus Dormibacteraeota bacterium]|nr:hypothetical protein [Candidatus Dormibacteraeota bacterium]